MRFIIICNSEPGFEAKWRQAKHLVGLALCAGLATDCAVHLRFIFMSKRRRVECSLAMFLLGGL